MHCALGDKHNNMLPTALCLSVQRMPRTEIGGQVFILGWVQRGEANRVLGAKSLHSTVFDPKGIR